MFRELPLKFGKATCDSLRLLISIPLRTFPPTFYLVLNMLGVSVSVWDLIIHEICTQSAS